WSSDVSSSDLSSLRLILLHGCWNTIRLAELAGRTSVLHCLPGRWISVARLFQRAYGDSSISVRISPLFGGDGQGQDFCIRRIFGGNRKLQHRPAADIFFPHVRGIFVGSFRISLSAARCLMDAARPDDLLGQSSRGICVGVGACCDLRRDGRLPPLYRSTENRRSDGGRTAQTPFSAPALRPCNIHQS